MHTRKKTLHHAPSRARRRQRRKKQVRKTCIKCALGISVFTLTLTAVCGLHSVKPESDSWIQFLTQIPANLFSDSGRQTMFTASTDRLPPSSSGTYSEHQNPVTGAGHDRQASDDAVSDSQISDAPGSDSQVSDDSGSDSQIMDHSSSDSQISDDSGSGRTAASSDGTSGQMPDDLKDKTPLPGHPDSDSQTSRSDDTGSARKRYIRDADSDKLNLNPDGPDSGELSEFPSDTDTQWIFFAETDSDSQLLSGPERVQTEQLLDTAADDSDVSHIRYDSDDWNLVLVNPWNKLPDHFEIRLARLPNGHSIDIRCYSALMEMMDACSAAGYSPLICSSYRTQEKQESLFQERIDELTAQGYSAKDARRKAATSVARPGTSEHQLGLAVDIVDKSHQMLDAAQEYTPVQQWLMQNSWKYGFILRYPQDKSSLTGIIYEPWHYRYVGAQAAQDIYERGICLEEYLEELG